MHYAYGIQRTANCQERRSSGGLHAVGRRSRSHFIAAGGWIADPDPPVPEYSRINNHHTMRIEKHMPKIGVFSLFHAEKRPHAVFSHCEPPLKVNQPSIYA